MFLGDDELLIYGLKFDSFLYFDVLLYSGRHSTMQFILNLIVFVFLNNNLL